MEELTTVAVSAITSLLFSKGASAPAHTIDLLWKATLGRWDQDLQKYIDRRDSNIQKYADSITEEVDKIPVKDLTDDPDISILGPALEASKYYIEKEIPRRMFAKLIAASMDKRKEGLVHHSFVEIIKEMSPNDAFILSQMTNPTTLLYCFIKRSDNREYSELISDIYLSDAIPEVYRENCLSISNLERLGLLYIPTRNMGNIIMHGEQKDALERFKNTKFCKELDFDCSNPSSPRMSYSTTTYDANLTELTFAFRQICL